MDRRRRALLLYMAIAVLIPVCILVWYESPAAGPFDLYPRLAAAYRAVGLDMALIQRNQLNHLIRACLAEPELWLTILYAAAPAIAGACAVWALAGGRGLRDFAGRYNPLRQMTAPRALALYALVLALCAALMGTQLLIARVIGLPLRVPPLGWGYMGANLLLGLVFNQGGLLKEGGWRGYLQPMLQDALRRPIRAAVVVGLIWAAWHLPRDVLKGEPFRDTAGYAASFGEFALYCVTTAIIHAWLLALGRGSLWPSIMFHGTGNTAEWLIGQTAPSAGALPAFLIENSPAGLGALLIIVFWRPVKADLAPISLPANEGAGEVRLA